MGLYKKGRSWYIDYYYPPGRAGRRIREKIGPVKDEAQIVLAARLADIRQGRNPETRRIDPKPFDDMVKEFKEKHVSQRRDKRGFEVSLTVLKRFFGGMTLQEITPGKIQLFVTGRLAEGVSQATVNRQRACLSKMFSLAIDWGYYGGENPVRRVKPFKESAGRARFLTAEEAEKLHAKAADHIKPVILTMLHTGGRVTEVLRLQWQDVDLQRGVLYFDQQNTKSGRQREVPLSVELAAMLKERRKVRGIRDEERFIFTWHGKPIARFATAFKTARKRADLGPDVTPHVLRHTYASHAVMNGLDLYRLQKYLGHSTLKLTERYSHLSEGHFKAGAEFFGPRSHPVDTSEPGSTEAGSQSA